MASIALRRAARARPERAAAHRPRHARAAAWHRLKRPAVLVPALIALSGALALGGLLGGYLPLGVAGIVMMAGISSVASAKSYEVERRLSDFFLNGGALGGDFKVNGNHTVTGDTTTQTMHINGTQKKMRQGPTTSPPGGAGGTYSAPYDSSLSQMGQDANTTGHNAGDWS